MIKKISDAILESVKPKEVATVVKSEIVDNNQIIINLQDSKVMNSLKDMFQQGLMSDKFSESGINSIEDLDNKSED